MGDLALLVALLIAAVCLALHNRHLADDEPAALPAAVYSPEATPRTNH